MYLILSGEVPYDFAISKEAEKNKKQRDPIAFILGNDKPVSIGKKVSGLSAKLVSAIDLAIEKDINKRFQTAKEFKKAIEGFAE